MRSIGTRLTIGYALSATLTHTGLFFGGYTLLEDSLSRGLNHLNEVEFHQITARLTGNLNELSSRDLEERVRATSEYDSALYYISIYNPQNGVHFQSSNLLGRPMPDVPGQHDYNAFVEGIGEMRANEFFLPPLDITIATPMRGLRETMSAYVRVGFGLLAFMLVASAAIGYWLSRLLLSPLRAISATANRIRSDNLKDRIRVSNVHDELSDLALLLNQMFDRLELAFDQVRRFADEASHELKTPLSIVRLHAEAMLRDGDLSVSNGEAVLVQLEEIERLNHIIDELLFLSRADAEKIVLNLEIKDPNQFLEVFSQDAVALAEHYHCKFEIQKEGDGRVAFEEKWMRQVLLNLLSNALAVSPPDAVVRLRSQFDKGVWRVSVIDQGPGIPPSQRSRVFERFVRLPGNNKNERGSGLGLTICKKVIELHHGRIFANGGVNGKGAEVVFELPAVAEHTTAVV